jgi:hypothetical protein
MRILLSSENFDGFGGTETYVLTVTQELERLGHQAWIYAPRGGAIAEHARTHGVRVVGQSELPIGCDAVIAQDAATSYELAHRYADAARMFVAHSRDHALQAAPQLPGVCDAVVVLNDRVRRWVEAQGNHPPITRLRQPINTWRFTVARRTQTRPRRVLISTNYVSGVRGELVQSACQACGLEVRWIGAKSSPTAHPEAAIADADIVIGLGRTALEAMAAGRATYIYGAMSGDGWVTPESYPAFEADGFAGLSNGRVIDADQLAADLMQWRPEMGEANRDLAYTHHAIRPHAIALVRVARELAAAPAAGSNGGSASWPGDELARLVRLEWQMFGRAMHEANENEQLRAQRLTCEQELERLRARVAELEASAHGAQQSMAELTATRRYRLAASIAAPLDWVRGRHRP